MTSPVAEYLRQHDIPFREFRHPGPVKSLEQAAQERGQLPEQVVRSILFRVTEGEYVMVLVAGPQQIAWPALRKYLGESRISMAKPDLVKQVTGYQIGAVSPFGITQPVRILVDQSVLEQEEISLGSGLRGTTIFIQVRNLMAALGDSEIVSLV
jgi:Cys-tRNA(Pro)/Cys-tRNA(Cys) deacylase